MNTPKVAVSKVAVIGASGIGKNHARWFHSHGCDVVAFVGSSPESVARTQKLLEDGFGFAGRGYVDVEAMLRVELPEVVCVSSPPPQHFAQVLKCLQAGAHVLCEKPLVYDPDLSSEEIIAQAGRLVEAAHAQGVLLGTQMQYGPAVEHLLKAANVEAGAVTDYQMLMETKNIKDKRDFEQIWIDLSPHPLSVLQKLGGQGATIDTGSIEATIGEFESVARFRVRRPGGATIQALVTVRFNPEANSPQRYFSFNGRRIDYAGRKNASGEFVSFLTAADGHETELPDLVDLLIGQWLQACRDEGEVPVSGEEGAQNVAWQFQILQSSR